MASQMDVKMKGWQDHLDVDLYVGDQIEVYIDGRTVSENWTGGEECESEREAIAAFAEHVIDRCQHHSNTGTGEERVELLRVKRIMRSVLDHPTIGTLREAAHRINEGA